VVVRIVNSDVVVSGTSTATSGIFPEALVLPSLNVDPAVTTSGVQGVTWTNTSTNELRINIGGNVGSVVPVQFLSFSNATNGDQTGISAEVNITGLIGLDFPGFPAPNGSKSFAVSFNVQGNDPNDDVVIVRLYAGSHGNKSDTLIYRFESNVSSKSTAFSVTVANFVFVPSPVQTKWGMSIASASSNKFSVYGGTTARRYSTVFISALT